MFHNISEKTSVSAPGLGAHGGTRAQGPGLGSQTYEIRKVDLVNPSGAHKEKITTIQHTIYVWI